MGRQIGVAMDFSKGSKVALKWASDCLLQSDDTLYVLHIRPSEASESRNLIWSTSGSPLIPLAEFRDASAMHGYGFELDHEVLDALDALSKCPANYSRMHHAPDTVNQSCVCELIRMQSREGPPMISIQHLISPDQESQQCRWRGKVFTWRFHQPR